MSSISDLYELMKTAFYDLKRADAEMRRLYDDIDTHDEEITKAVLHHCEIVKESLRDTKTFSEYMKDQSGPAYDQVQLLLDERLAWDKDAAAFWEPKKAQLLQQHARLL
jgi:hypothetical protein